MHLRRLHQTNKRVGSVLLAGSLCCCFFPACARKGQSNPPAGSSKAVTKTVQASVQRTNTLKKLTELRLGSEPLSAIQFIDSNRGWIASASGSLYRTDDRGATWTKRSIPLPSGAALGSLYFVSSTKGWVAARKNGADVLNPNSDEFWIMHSNDGGDTWTVQFSGEAAQVERIRFVSETEGWAVGVRFAEKEVLQALPFILHTESQGQNWTNVSEQLSSDKSVNGITDVHSTKGHEATIVTVHGRLFRTTNAGKDWHELSSADHESSETYFGRLGQTASGHLWLLGGSDSLEGMSGVFARQESNETWLRFHVGSYFRDAVLISEKEIVVCGHTRPDSKPIAFGGHAEGVILRSSDGGQNWTVVYQNKDVKSINALAVINGTVWTVGENGFVLRIELPE